MGSKWCCGLAPGMLPADWGECGRPLIRPVGHLLPTCGEKELAAGSIVPYPRRRERVRVRGWAQPLGKQLCNRHPQSRSGAPSGKNER